MRNDPRIITIDGPAGVGKSTLARRMAETLNIPYLDTGAMFRCLALALKGEVGTDDAALRRSFDELEFDLRDLGEGARLVSRGIAPGNAIRSEEAGLWASRIAGDLRVRELMKEAQQTLGARCSLVAEGRDMGTVVFPQAGRKFFLDADPGVRALRRLRELEARGETPDFAALEAAIRERDKSDRERVAAPLKPAPDAILVDTSHLDIDGVFAALMRHIEHPHRLIRA